MSLGGPLPQRLLDLMNPEAEQALRRLIDGALRTQAVHAVASLGIADALAGGPRSAEELAAGAGGHALTLKRILRVLVTDGIFVEHEDGRFGLAPAGEYLQTAHPRSLRAAAVRAGSGLWQSAARLLEAVRTGRTPHDLAHGAAFFDRVAATAGSAGRFASRMGLTAAELGRELAVHPALAGARSVVDVGGGNGTLLAALLDRRPHLRGILLDRPEVVPAAREVLDAAGVAERCEIVAGDFFSGVPAGGDVYVLCWILHDWDDARARQIIARCREAGARSLVVIEVPLPERATFVEGGTAGYDPFALDLQMLLLTGGRERTRDEYRALLLEAGYVLGEPATSADPAPMSRQEASRGATFLHAVARD